MFARLSGQVLTGLAASQVVPYLWEKTFTRGKSRRLSYRLFYKGSKSKRQLVLMYQFVLGVCVISLMHQFTPNVVCIVNPAICFGGVFAD